MTSEKFIGMDVHQATTSVAVSTHCEGDPSLGPMHGYGIAQHIQQTSEHVLQVEESLHPALREV